MISPRRTAFVHASLEKPKRAITFAHRKALVYGSLNHAPVVTAAEALIRWNARSASVIRHGGLAQPEFVCDLHVALALGP